MWSLATGPNAIAERFEEGRLTTTMTGRPVAKTASPGSTGARLPRPPALSL
jgi:hypothetical protein